MMKSCSEKANTQGKFQLNRALSVRVGKTNLSIEIGWNPPTAATINNPPSYIKEILEALNTPLTLEALMLKLTSEHPEIAEEELIGAIEDLRNLKVIQPYILENRYHRHQLYFDFLNVELTNYSEILSSKKVGLIGSGGIGSTVAMLLAAAGVGQIVLLDEDYLEESNLTRTLLFEESDIGTRKVIAAKERLESRNSNISVTPVIRSGDTDVIKQSMSDCDIWVLSADNPPYQIHKWTNSASIELNIPYIIAGYVEIFGSVGPLFIPGTTSCYECIAKDRNSFSYKEINSKLQAASYGPLNSLVSSIAANEIIRYLLDLKVKTLGTRLLIDSRDYRISTVEFQPNDNCVCRQCNVLK